MEYRCHNETWGLYEEKFTKINKDVIMPFNINSMEDDNDIIKLKKNKSGGYFN